MDARRFCPLGNRAEKLNRPLGQLLRTRPGTKACQRAKSRLDSPVNLSGPFAGCDERLDSIRSFSGCQTQAIVEYERFFVVAKRPHKAFLIRGEESAAL